MPWFKGEKREVFFGRASLGVLREQKGRAQQGQGRRASATDQCGTSAAGLECEG